MELAVISKMGFEGYFLIVQDFINYARNNDIAIGPGRGERRWFYSGFFYRNYES